MNEVLGSPFLVVVMHLPLIINVKVSQVVRLRHVEFLSCIVTFLLAAFGAEEYRGDTQHGDDCEYL